MKRLKSPSHLLWRSCLWKGINCGVHWGVQLPLTWLTHWTGNALSRRSCMQTTYSIFTQKYGCGSGSCFLLMYVHELHTIHWHQTGSFLGKKAPKMLHGCLVPQDGCDEYLCNAYYSCFHEHAFAAAKDFYAQCSQHTICDYSTCTRAWDNNITYPWDPVHQWGRGGPEGLVWA